MLKENEIDPENLSKGDIVQFENKHTVACIVEVLDVKTFDTQISIEVKTLDVIFGNPNDTFTITHTLRDEYSHYVKSKFKEVGSMTDYVRTGDLDDHRDEVEKLRKKYGG